MLLLIERGLLELDAPVARYWPAFGAAGKEGVLVRHVLSHTAGVPGLRTPFGRDEMLDREFMARRLVVVTRPASGHDARLPRAHVRHSATS
jgi:CubicO group peptidase (beta-lactamase class C family)